MSTKDNEREAPWIALRDVAYMYGVTYETAKNKVLAGTFPVPVRKVGKIWVILKHVHEGYFAKLTAEDLETLANSK